MENISIQPTHKTLGITLNAQKGYIFIKGRFLLCPVDKPYAFIEPAIEWIKEYLENPAPVTTADVFVEYMNTCNQRVLFRIFKILMENKPPQSKETINWLYENNNCDAKESGELLASLLKTDVNLVNHTSDNYY